ncbi:hyaluronoglucosaminidase, partial [Dictyocaulus viviparus]
QVYWNVPSKVCYNQQIDIPLNQFGIKHNIGHEFMGDQIVIFYEYNFGYFPYYRDGDANQPVNGGLPQKCPIDKHLARVSEQIREVIPREDFRGIAVIDFEEWRPLYKLNWGKKAVYKKESIQLVRQQYPSISKKSAEEMARKEFDAAAKKIFLSTIQLAQQLRPFARWGFYGFPYCNYDAGNSSTNMLCNENFRGYNNEMSFIFEASTALFPSIYLSLKGTSAQNYHYIQAIMVESARIAALRNPQLDVYPYTKFEYDPYTVFNSFYVKKDVCNSLKQAADLGARGIILWSTSKNMKQRCDGLAKYVREMLGPTVALIRKRIQRCREKWCSGQGQCVLPEPASQCTFRMQPEKYICHCDSFFTGNHCSLREQLDFDSYSNSTTVTSNGSNGKRRPVSRRRKLKKFRFIKVFGEAKSRTDDDKPADEKLLVIDVDSSPLKKFKNGRLYGTGKEKLSHDKVSITSTPTFMATSVPLDLTTPYNNYKLTPSPIDFRLA